MSRPMLLAKLLISLLPVVRSIQRARQFRATEDGPKPLRQIGRCGELRSLLKQMAEEQPGFQHRSAAGTGSNTKRSEDAWVLSSQAWSCCSSGICICTPISGRSRNSHSSIGLLRSGRDASFPAPSSVSPGWNGSAPSEVQSLRAPPMMNIARGALLLRI